MSNLSLNMMKAKSYFREKDYSKCLGVLTSLLDIGDKKEIYTLMGRSYYRLERYNQALDSFGKVLEINEDHGLTHFRMALVYEDQRLYEKSVACYRRALECDPGHESSLLNLGRLYFLLGDKSEAKRVYKHLLKIKPHLAGAYLNFGLCFKYESEDQEEIHKLKELLKNPALSQENKIECHFALGKAYDDCDLYHKAFSHMLMGNALRGVSIPFNFKDYRSSFDKITEVFSQKRLPAFDGVGSISEKPIFILGLPRAGKTLVESMLKNHRDICGADEANIIGDVVYDLESILGRHARYPRDIASITKADGFKLAGHCLKKLENICSYSHHKTVDTTPTYFRHLGLLATLFPNAKYIHCTRNPLDQCLQIFFSYFTSGHAYSYDLQSLGNYYNLYREQMSYWKSVLDIDILDVSYEDLLDDPQKVQDNIFQFIGFDNRDRDCFLAEISQREKGRWKCYEEYLYLLAEIVGTH